MSSVSAPRITVTGQRPAITVHVATGTGSGGGAVASVNGKTGAVVLAAADVGADPVGAAAAVAELIPDVSGFVDDTDPRLSDARAPLAHTHTVADIVDMPVIPNIDLLHQPRHEIVVPGGGAAAVTFDIDPSWRDIRIEGWATCQHGSNVTMRAILNGDTNPVYASTLTGRSGGGNTLTSVTGETSGQVAWLSRDASSPDNTRSTSFTIGWPGDMPPGRRVQLVGTSGASNTTSEAVGGGVAVVEWAGDAPVSSITLFPSGSAFTGGRFTLSARKVAS